jgi:hypothetical protein
VIPPLVYAHLIKYLTEYAARQIAARLGLQVTPPARTPTEPVQNRTESAPVVRIPDDAFEIPSFDPVKETLSEEERLNRHTEYEHAQLRFRIEEQGLAEQRAELEQERRALEESRNPEKLAAEEARRHQEVFDAETGANSRSNKSISASRMPQSKRMLTTRQAATRSDRKKKPQRKRNSKRNRPAKNTNAGNKNLKRKNARRPSASVKKNSARNSWRRKKGKKSRHRSSRTTSGA